jgi:predicted enzyme related to lactoylglutathione lyase
MSVRFTGCELRTTDVAGAQAFYEGVLGDAPAAVTALPAQAIARGAPSHWLALVRVADVASEEAAWLAAGAEKLGPTRDDGSVVLRDPFGAAIALTSKPGDGARAWHELHVIDPAGAFAFYAARLGWSRVGEPAADEAITFAWGGAAIGRITALARTPGVHTHWVFYDEVDGFDGATSRVRSLGGTVTEVRAVPGARVAYCEDPQGAAFGLRSR